MPVDVSKVVKLVEESKGYETQIKELREKANKLLTEARELCDHPATEEKSSYFDGSYLDHASTTTDTYCVICGKKLGSETITHSWYG